MNIEQAVLQLGPCWILGIVMIALTWFSQYRDVLKIDKSVIIKFAKILAIGTAARLIVFHFFAPAAVIEQMREMTKLIPWQALFGVFWEDACFSMPLVLAGLMFNKSKLWSWLSKPMLAVVMASFACGHLYQGLSSALMISLYIPFAMQMGKKYGYGTVMLCHIMYDFSTLLSLKWMLG